jgi:hypothetical protein
VWPASREVDRRFPMKSDSSYADWPIIVLDCAALILVMGRIATGLGERQCSIHCTRLTLAFSTP